MARTPPQNDVFGSNFSGSSWTTHLAKDAENRMSGTGSRRAAVFQCRFHSIRLLRAVKSINSFPDAVCPGLHGILASHRPNLTNFFRKICRPAPFPGVPPPMNLEI
jgi:hypothetical protein